MPQESVLTDVAHPTIQSVPLWGQRLGWRVRTSRVDRRVSPQVCRLPYLPNRPLGCVRDVLSSVLHLVGKLRQRGVPSLVTAR